MNKIHHNNSNDCILCVPVGIRLLTYSNTVHCAIYYTRLWTKALDEKLQWKLWCSVEYRNMHQQDPRKYSYEYKIQSISMQGWQQKIVC